MENKNSFLVVITQNVDPIDLVVPLLPLCCTCMMEFSTESSKGMSTYKKRMRCLDHWKACGTFAFTDVKLEDKCVQAKLVEALRTNYICEDIHHQWRVHPGFKMCGLHSQIGKGKVQIIHYQTRLSVQQSLLHSKIKHSKYCVLKKRKKRKLRQTLKWFQCKRRNRNSISKL